MISHNGLHRGDECVTIQYSDRLCAGDARYRHVLGVTLPYRSIPRGRPRSPPPQIDVSESVKDERNRRTYHPSLSLRSISWTWGLHPRGFVLVPTRACRDLALSLLLHYPSDPQPRPLHTWLRAPDNPIPQNTTECIVNHFSTPFLLLSPECRRPFRTMGIPLHPPYPSPLPLRSQSPALQSPQHGSRRSRIAKWRRLYVRGRRVGLG